LSCTEDGITALDAEHNGGLLRKLLRFIPDYTMWDEGKRPL